MKIKVVFWRLVRFFISPPFWVLIYEFHAYQGPIEHGDGMCALLSNPNDQVAAECEAEKYLKKTALVSGTYSYIVRLRPWYLRLRFSPNNPYITTKLSL